MANLGTQFECNPIGALAEAQATIDRLTKERDEAHERFVFWRNEADKRTAALAQARTEAAAAYERAANVTMCVGDHQRIRALATEADTTALAEMLDAEARACAQIASTGLWASKVDIKKAILARIDQRKGAGE